MAAAAAREMRPERLALPLRHNPVVAGTRMMAYIPSQWEAQGKFLWHIYIALNGSGYIFCMKKNERAAMCLWLKKLWRAAKAHALSLSCLCAPLFWEWLLLEESHIWSHAG